MEWFPEKEIEDLKLAMELGPIATYNYASNRANAISVDNLRRVQTYLFSHALTLNDKTALHLLERLRNQYPFLCHD